MRKTDCGCRDLLLRRLFADFSAVGTPDRREWGPMALAVLLGISEEHATILLDLGLIEGAPGVPWVGPDRVSTVAVLRFLERHGPWLAVLRVEQQIEVLRARLARDRRAHGAPVRSRTGRERTTRRGRQ
jgi:hypothetical protein